MMKYEIGAMVEAKSGSLIDWYEGQIVGYDDTNDIYVLHMCEEYPFTPYAGFSEDRIRELPEPTVIHVVLNSSSLSDLNHMREKMGREPLNEIDTEQLKQNPEDVQIEERAAMLYDIYVRGQFEVLENLRPRPFSKLDEHHISGFKAIARHLATPRASVQHALQAALESERELMDILRKIGKVFGKNVGTDIGILDLPKLVDGEIEELRALNATLTLGRDNLFKWRNQLQCDLVDLIVEKKSCARPRPGYPWSDDKILAELRELEKPEPTIRQDHRLSPEYVRILQSLTGCKVKTEMDGTSEEDMVLLQKMIDNYARLREVEGKYKQLAEKVADAFSYCPTNLR